MRDDHDQMPEIIGAFEKSGSYFGIIQLERNHESRRFQTELTHASYLALKNILALRPFSTMPGVAYRYFFAPVWFKTLNGKRAIVVRVEQGRDSKQIDMEATQELSVTLTWFFLLKDWGEAEHLRQESATIAEPPAV